MTKPIAFITGATAGIGRATAELLSSKYRLILCGRRSDRLEELQKTLDTDVLTLSFDVRSRDDVRDSIKTIPSEWSEISVLINNAGNAHGLDFIHEGSLDDWDAMIDINVKGLLYVSRELIPGMVERKAGHIINIGSIAGKEVYPKGNVYNASKFAVDAISEGMRIDLNAHKIKVTQISPGLVNTEFSAVRFKGDQERADGVYSGMTPLYAKDIAEVIDFCLNRPSHVNIADLVVLPTDQASSTVVRRDS